MNTQTLSFDVLERSTQKTNQILNFIEERYGWKEHRNYSYAALRAVLHTLRDRLPVELAVGFGAQLPIFVRGVYYEGWNPSKVPQKMKREEFLNAIRGQLLFSYETSELELIQTVIGAIKNIIDPLEIEKIQKTLPDDLKDLLD